MQNSDTTSLAHFITRVAGIDGLSEPIEVHIILNRTEDSGSPIAVRAPVAGENAQTSPYTQPLTTNLSMENRQGLDNLAYWRNGFRASKSYIINQALAQYLAQYKESKWAIPTEGVLEDNKQTSR